MYRRQLFSIGAVAAVALLMGFLVAGQVKAQLLTPSNQVARYHALVRSVQDLEATNAESRRLIAALRSEIDALESDAAGRSAATQALQNQVADLRAHAGLTAMHGPGVAIDLANGVPGPDIGAQASYLVNFQDVQDIVNLLFAQGAEGVAVNGRRITPLTADSGAALVAVVGIVQIRSQAEGERSLVGIDTTSLAFLIDDLHRANDSLQAEAADLQARQATLRSGTSGAADQVLNDEANRLRAIEGLVPVHGPGVVIVIAATGLTARHLQDALDNPAAGGADAPSVNDHRVVTGVSIEQTTAGVVIDGSVVPPPWTITSIGDANRLAEVANLMTQALTADRRVREATYRTESDVGIRSVVSSRPFVYAVAS